MRIESSLYFICSPQFTPHSQYLCLSSVCLLHHPTFILNCFLLDATTNHFYYLLAFNQVCMWVHLMFAFTLLSRTKYNVDFGLFALETLCCQNPVEVICQFFVGPWKQTSCLHALSHKSLKVAMHCNDRWNQPFYVSGVDGVVMHPIKSAWSHSWDETKELVDHWLLFFKMSTCWCHWNVSAASAVILCLFVFSHRQHKLDNSWYFIYLS